jgi:hypothetical protein
MSETSSTTVETLNSGLVIPEFDLEELKLWENDTSVHAVHRWFGELLQENGITDGMPLVLATKDDNKAVWIWQAKDESRERVVDDPYSRGSAYVSPRTIYNVGIVSASAFVPEVIFTIGSSFVSQGGSINLSPLANDEADCQLFVGGKWEDVRGADLRSLQFYGSETQYGKELRRQDELLQQAVKGFANYIS